ncbi:hypothetical protein P8452_64437 [Trifolium repens]|nr:hypothetical protein P8452_64437 [Trifolium repens]
MVDKSVSWPRSCEASIRRDTKTLMSFFCVLLNKIIRAILPANRVAVAFVIVSVTHIGCCGQRFARNRHFAAG